MTVPLFMNGSMDGFYFYTIFICAATLMAVIGAVVGLLVIRKRTYRGKRSGSFGSVIKMPTPKQPIFPISLYKQTETYHSANDLSNVEAQPDAGLASESRAAVVEWRRETGSGESDSSAKGAEKWVVHFKMRYDVALETLEVRLLRASTTGALTGDPSSSLFFNIYLTPHLTDCEHKQSSLRQFHSTTTTFDQTFFFRLRNSDAVSTILRLSLYIVDGGQTRTCLGHVAQPMCGLEIFDGAVHYLTRDLGTMETANIEGCLGETLVSLCYQMQKEKLKVRVLDARHLPPQTPSDSKYYLQIDIIIGDHIVKTKRTTPHHLLQHVFDCAYAFLIPSKHMELCALVITIVEVMESNGQLVRERPWGRFTIGPCSYAHGTGVDHWKMMLANSTKVIEMWHVIARAY